MKTRRIKLTKGQFAIVYEGDFLGLNQFKWYADYRPKEDTWYAARRTSRKLGKSKMVYMHREIMGLACLGKEVDHEDRDGLNNRRSNLRIATRSQNGMNRKINKNNTSGYKGVYWHKQHQKWCAQIKINNKKIHLGYFDNKIDAVKARDEAAKKYHGEFARLK